MKHQSKSAVRYSRKTVVVALTLLSLCMATLVAICLFHMFVFDLWWNKERIEAEIHGSLPIGTSKAQVEAWLKERGYRYYYETDLTEIIFQEGHRSIVQESELNIAYLQGVIVVWIPDGKLSLVFPSRIFLFFFIDEKGHLKKTIIKYDILFP